MMPGRQFLRKSGSIRRRYFRACELFLGLFEDLPPRFRAPERSPRKDPRREKQAGYKILRHRIIGCRLPNSN